MSRASRIFRIVLLGLVAAGCTALAYKVKTDGRPVTMWGKWSGAPREVSANKVAGVIAFNAALSFCLASLFFVELVRDIRLDRMSKRIMAGLCPHCGYVLGDTTGTATCPECGGRNSLTRRRQR